MVNVYSNLRDDDGNIIRGRTKVFIGNEDVSDDGTIKNYNAGVAVVPEESGRVYVIDQHILKQISKLKVRDGDLVVKDGETLDVPEKTAEEIEREQLLARLAELDGVEEQPQEGE